MQRRASLGLFLFVLALVPAEASEPGVPIDLQAALIGKVVRYDRNFSARSGDTIKVLLAYRPKNPDSDSAARQMQAALQALPLLGGIKHTEELTTFTSAAELVAQAKERQVTLVIVGPGFDDVIPELAKAFDGFDCLTLSTADNAVERGIVLGFDLVSGKPRILLNLAQARRQNADFKAEALKVMKVIQ